MGSAHLRLARYDYGRDGRWVLGVAAAPRRVGAGGTSAPRGDVGALHGADTLLCSRVVKSMPRQCLAVNVHPLLRELILFATRIGALDQAVAKQARLIGVILDQIETLATIPVQLPAPRDERAVRVAEFLRRDPCSRETLVRLAKRAGAAPRTIERIFRSETKMSFSEWRARLRLLEALKRLAAGEPVTQVSLDVGYNSPSAFIARFKKELGATPGRFQLS